MGFRFSIVKLPSNHQLVADILLKLPAFDQLFGSDIEDERAIRTAQHTIDLVDPNIAVCCGFLNSQRHFEVDRHLQFLGHTVTTCVLLSELLA